jgi:DNA mismatch repair protein MSH2
METLLAQIKTEASEFAYRTDIELEKKLKFENSPQFGHHLRVSRADGPKVRGDKQYIELKTQKAGALFTTVKIRRISEEHQDQSKQYQKLQSSIVKEVIEMTGSYFPVLDDTNKLVAELDLYVTFADVAVYAPIPYVRPVMKVHGDIMLKSSRHPCVERQDDVSFIENDVELIDSKSMFHIITGPNVLKN